LQQPHDRTTINTHIMSKINSTAVAAGRRHGDAGPLRLNDQQPEGDA